MKRVIIAELPLRRKTRDRIQWARELRKIIINQLDINLTACQVELFSNGHLHLTDNNFSKALLPTEDDTFLNI